MANTLKFRGGSTTDIASSTVSDREIVFDTDKNTLVLGSAKDYLMRYGGNSQSGNVGIGVASPSTALDVNGTVTATSFAGPITGNVTGNLTGNVTGNLTGNVTGNVTGNLTGDVTGDVTGNLTGNVTGNLTGTASNADTLDGVNSSQFLRSDNTDTVTAKTTWDLSATDSISLNKPATTSYAGMTFSEVGDDRFLMYLNNTTDGSLNLQARKNGTNFKQVWSVGLDGVQDFVIEPTISGNKVWHAGNDGSGSGLDADLLDGQTRTEANTGNTVVSRNSSGDINCRLIRQEYQNQSTISGGMVFRVNDSSDNYLRVCNSPSAIRSFLQVRGTNDDVLPPNDNAGQVGTSARTWNTGRFTNFNVDNLLSTNNINASGQINLVGGSDSNRYIDAQTGSGALYIRGTTGGDSGHSNMILAQRGGRVGLFYNGSEALQTLNDSTYGLGINITGGLLRIQNYYTAPSTPSANVRMTSTGYIQRISSTRAVKTNIESITDQDAINFLENARPVTFNGIDEPEGHKKSYGFIAEEMSDVNPMLTEYDENGNPISVEYGCIPTVLTKIVQLQSDRIEALEARLAALEAG